MRKDQTMKAILQAIAAKEAEIERLNIEIGALRAVYNQEAGIKTEKPRAARSNVKNIVFELLKNVGSNGLNAQIAVDLAKEQGISLNVKSASSLLSRLKQDGAVHHNGQVYVLKEFSTRPVVSLPSDTSGVVRPLRTSGQVS